MAKRDNIKKSISSLLIVTTLLLSLGGCGSSSKKNKTITIPDEITIEEVLNSISTISKFDENLAKATIDDKTFEDLLIEYRNARQEKNKNDCNNCLYDLGLLLAKASLSEQLGIDYENLTKIYFQDENHEIYDYILYVKYKEDNSYIAAGNIFVENITEKEVKIYPDGELYKLLVNIYNANMNLWEFPENAKKGEPTIDDVYKALIRFMLTEENKLKKSKFSEDKMDTYKCNLSIDSQKMDAYEKMLVK